MAAEALTPLKAGTGWIEVEVVGEADVVLTFRGYAPALRVKVIKSGLVKQLYIGAKSLATALEELRRKNGNKFIGIRFRFKKESEETMSQYIVEEIR